MNYDWMQERPDKIVATKTLINQVKPFWRRMREIQFDFNEKISNLEEEMSKDLQIENMEFFWCDNDIVGVGNANRTLELIHYNDLDTDDV